MANVKVSLNADMTQLASGGGGAIGPPTDSLEVYAAADASYVLLIGSFVGFSGTISRALFATDDDAFVAPDIEVTGLSFQFTQTYSTSVIFQANFSGLLADLLAGNDTVIGSNFAFGEVLLGHAGNDVLIGGAGGDDLRGGSGTDTASYATAAAGVYAVLDFPVSNTGDAAGDLYSSIENLTGSRFNDVLFGDFNANALSGGNGNDELRGFSGNDTLIGGLGRDLLFGDEGADTFDFNSKSETVKGGNRDRIMDFQRGPDHINLKDIDAKSGGGNQNFKWIGKSKFDDEKGELRYIDKGSTVIVQGDTNGDGKADFEIFVNVGALAKGDFVL